LPNVRFGSLADIQAATTEGPLSANNSHSLVLLRTARSVTDPSV
jgi:hypothetical protein